MMVKIWHVGNNLPQYRSIISTKFGLTNIVSVNNEDWHFGPWPNNSYIHYLKRVIVTPAVHPRFSTVNNFAKSLGYNGQKKSPTKNFTPDVNAHHSVKVFKPSEYDYSVTFYAETSISQLNVLSVTFSATPTNRSNVVVPYPRKHPISNQLWHTASYNIHTTAHRSRLQQNIRI